MFRVFCLFAIAAVVSCNERILGGLPVNITEVSYQASLQFRGKHECGGTIISDRVILTAAHCIEGSLRFFFTVRVGSAYRNDGGQVYRVDKIKLHPSYDSITVDYDVALVYLKERLIFSESIRDIPCARKLEPVGTECKISATSNSGHSNKLLVGSVNLIAQSDCAKTYGDELTDRMVCAGVPDNSVDSCGGDSGGAMVCGGKVSGIVSWGRKCGRNPGVYANVPRVWKWIRRNAGL